MEFLCKLEFRGFENLTTSKGQFIRYYFENAQGKGFQFVSKKQYQLEKGKIYNVTLQANQLFLNDIKGV